MSWTVKLSSHAEKYFFRLDRKTRDRMRQDLAALSKMEDPLRHEQVKPLVGELRGYHRLRAGSYRIVFNLIVSGRIIAVVNVAPRGDVY